MFDYKFLISQSITILSGTGKSTLASQLATDCSMTYLDISSIVKENSFYEEYDETNECHVLDEDKLLDFIEVRWGLIG